MVFWKKDSPYFSGQGLRLALWLDCGHMCGSQQQCQHAIGISGRLACDKCHAPKRGHGMLSLKQSGGISRATEILPAKQDTDVAERQANGANTPAGQACAARLCLCRTYPKGSSPLKAAYLYKVIWTIPAFSFSIRQFTPRYWTSTHHLVQSNPSQNHVSNMTTMHRTSGMKNMGLDTATRPRDLVISRLQI